MGQFDPGWMEGQRAEAEAIRQADANREAALLGHLGSQRAKIANGTYRPEPEWVPKRDQFEVAVRRSLGIEDPEAPVDTSPVHMGMSTNARQAWESFSDADQLAIRDDHDPELTAEYERRKNAAIVGEEEEAE
jgi:hypothetical protein